MLCKSLKQNRNLKKGAVSENVQCTNLTVWLTVKDASPHAINVKSSAECINITT